MFKTILNYIYFLSCFLVIAHQSKVIKRVENIEKRKKRDSPSLISIKHLSDAEKKIFVDEHNEYRKVASLTASNIRMVSWDDELAEHVEAHVRSCKWGNSPLESRMHSVFSNHGIGENLHHVDRYDSSTIKFTVQVWKNEKQNYNYYTGKCRKNYRCDQYLQVIWADTYKIGCAMAICSNFVGRASGVYIGCWYGPAGNVKELGDDGSYTDSKPYLRGPVCSQCGDSFSECLDRLCVKKQINSVSSSTDPSVITEGNGISIVGTTAPTIPCITKNCTYSTVKGGCVVTSSHSSLLQVILFFWFLSFVQYIDATYI